MTRIGQHDDVVKNITIPALTECVFATRTYNSHLKGPHIIEENLQSPCRTLLVARALVDPVTRDMPCRVLNPTDKPIKLRAGTPIGLLQAVTVASGSTAITHSSAPRPSVAHMRAALEARSVSFTDTAVTGPDLDNLITLLYNNIDLMATSLNDLPGTDILLHRIDTGNSPPIRTRSYRHSPADNEEIRKQTAEMLAAGIIEESDTAWGSPVLLVKKKDGSKRFVVDFRNVNAVSRLTSFPLPTLEEILDAVSTQRPLLWTSLDLRSGYWQTSLDPSTADRTGFTTQDGNFCSVSAAYLSVYAAPYNFFNRS